MNVPKTIITRILATIFIGLTFCWQSLSAQQGVQDGSQPSGNFWLGGVDADWSSSANWLLGDVSLLPDSSLDAYIGPILDLQSGRFMFPIGPALLDRDFSSPRLRLSAFDGISELTLTGGANYETFAIIGFAPENGYLPSDPIQPAKLILDGCSLSGLWLFVPDSEVVVLSDFVQPEFIWQGVVDKLSIASEQQLEISSLVSVRNEIDNQGIIQIPDGATRRLELVDDTVLFGGGFITLALNEQSILTGAEGASLTNLDNTIFGSGTIDVELFNQGPAYGVSTNMLLTIQSLR